MTCTPAQATTLLADVVGGRVGGAIAIHGAAVWSGMDEVQEGRVRGIAHLFLPAPARATDSSTHRATPLMDVLAATHLKRCARRVGWGEGIGLA